MRICISSTLIKPNVGEDSAPRRSSSVRRSWRCRVHTRIVISTYIRIVTQSQIPSNATDKASARKLHTRRLQEQCVGLVIALAKVLMLPGSESE